jgi:putative colanic acid biosynthesis acetyltransferase WcaF
MRLDLYDKSSFDRGAWRVTEALWFFCQGIFFLPRFPWPSSLRVGLLRLFGARIGMGLVIRSGVTITFPWRFTAGDHVWIGEQTTILSLAPVRLGSQVCLSQRVYLCSGSHDWRSETFDLAVRPIVIEEGAWVAALAFVGPGVTIGRGSVVSAGTVLLQSVPPESFARGNPAVVTAKPGHRPSPGGGD